MYINIKFNSFVLRKVVHSIGMQLIFVSFNKLLIYPYLAGGRKIKFQEGDSTPQRVYPNSIQHRVRYRYRHNSPPKSILCLTRLCFSILFTGPVRQVFAVVHGSASLPCDIAPPIPHNPQDTVILVAWYRNEKTAIYR